MKLMNNKLCCVLLLCLITSSQVQAQTGIAEFFPDGSPFQAGRPPLATRPVGDAAVMRTLADALGFIRFYGPRETTDTINRLMWRGAGTLVENGKTLTVTQYTYNTSLLLNAAREDLKLMDDAGNERRIVRVVSGDLAWDETEPGVDAKSVPGQSKVRLLRHARTPFGFTRFMLKAAPGTVKVVDGGQSGKVTITVPVLGVATTATLNAHYRPESITQTIGGKRHEARYADYKDISEYGVMFATHIVETVGGKTTLDLKIDDGRTSSYAVFIAPEGIKADR